MLCISVAPVSRTLAKADLLNAAGQCDLVEFCLDHFVKEPYVGELMEGIPKPLIVACRRSQDGGAFPGTEEQRLRLLREAIAAGPAYVELDLETAGKIPRFGKTQRVISIYLNGPPNEINPYYEQALAAHADVVQFAWPTPSFESAWPLLRLLSQKRAVPIVALGIGRAAVTVALVGKVLDAPWNYAALERGMESAPGLPSVHVLNDVYSWADINGKTRFIALAGSVDRRMEFTAKTLNAAFRSLGERLRCLPLPLQSADDLKERLERLKIPAAIVAPELALGAAKIADRREGSAEPTGYGDLLLHQPEGWTAYNAVWRHAIDAIEHRLGNAEAHDHPLDRRNVMVVGSGPLAHAIVYGVQRRKGIVSVTAPDDRRAQQLARQFEVRHIPFASLYDTLADVVILTDAALEAGHTKNELNPGYFRPSMTLADFSAMPYESPLLAEARQRGCRLVEPADAYRRYLAAQFQSVTGKAFPSDTFPGTVIDNS